MGRAKNYVFKDASEQAYHGKKQMISDYQLVPGQKITYIQLAEKLKMSNTPIINALKKLEQEEFAISIPNRGYFIKEINIKELNELFMIRESLEVLAIEAGIKNQTPEKLKEIEKVMINHREHNPGIVTRKRFALDAKFHLELAEMTHNHNLVSLIKNIFERINLRYRSEGFPVERLAQAAKEHAKIYHAIQTGAISKAKKLMKSHVRGAKEATIRGLKKGEEIFSL